MTSPAKARPEQKQAWPSGAVLKQPSALRAALKQLARPAQAQGRLVGCLPIPLLSPLHRHH